MRRRVPPAGGFRLPTPPLRHDARRTCRVAQRHFQIRSPFLLAVPVIVTTMQKATFLRQPVRALDNRRSMLCCHGRLVTRDAVTPFVM